MSATPPRGRPLPSDPPPVEQPRRGRSLPAQRTLPPVLDPDATPAPESRQLVPHQNKLERIGDHVAALSADFREYVELRIALVRAEIKEKIEEVKAEVERKGRKLLEPYVFYAAAGFVGLYLLGFFLATLAAAVAWLVGETEVLMPAFVGLLVVTLLLAIIAGVLAWLGRRKQKQNEVEVELPSPSEDGAARPSRAEIQEQEATHTRQSAV